MSQFVPFWLKNCAYVSRGTADWLCSGLQQAESQTCGWFPWLHLVWIHSDSVESTWGSEEVSWTPGSLLLKQNGIQVNFVEGVCPREDIKTVSHQQMGLYCFNRVSTGTDSAETTAWAQPAGGDTARGNATVMTNKQWKHVWMWHFAEDPGGRQLEDWID